MIPLVIDTNVVSFAIKGHALARLYGRYLHGDALGISFMTVAELYHGAFQARWSRQRLAKLARDLDTYVILESSLELCLWWADVRCQRRRRPISAEDAWIAAAALAYDCPLVTHNPGDFAGIRGLEIITAA